jgi:hypothetical protein
MEENVYNVVGALSNTRQGFNELGLNPIIFVNGIANQVAGGMMGVADIVGYGKAHFKAVNSVFFDYSMATYPVGSQADAANALFQNQVPITMLMTFPVSNNLGWSAKRDLLMNLFSQIRRHNEQGGLFNIYTSNNIYRNCVCIRAEEDQNDPAQVILSFTKPVIVTEADAQQVKSTQLNKMDSGIKVAGDPPAGSVVGDW